MAATLCGKLLSPKGWLPRTQSIRHGSKAVTRHRKPMHFLKQKLLAVTQYIPPKPAAPPGAYPRETPVVQEQESPLMRLLTRDLEGVFRDCKMVAVAQNSGSTSHDMIMLKNRFHKHDIHVRLFPNQVMRSFLSKSIYSNMAPLFIGPTVLFVSKEPKVKEMLSTLRLSPQMSLLGACIDNTLLSAQGVASYAKLSSVAVVQGELVSGLSALASQTGTLLQRHPTHLTALLQQYAAQQAQAEKAT
ncbi:large ribosomal subunit protein uL10m isoform X2 [Hippocampus comes]|uniref:large ribosomal subunit protein uL10m isoform X1 n=1 Tax=Hippocampus comes TaxID=109280 RepID=UPI00094EAAE3|nr:PREDICTED: 39S ribosomal protein L10, mitochondrial isoform X1 [Hippocampus comes]XP_019749380.1 PREDICTED: 39S ribosomal protein L10, mitochondrial isoform X2 [Hippocampus comes]